MIRIEPSLPAIPVTICIAMLIVFTMWLGMDMTLKEQKISDHKALHDCVDKLNYLHPEWPGCAAVVEYVKSELEK